MGKITAVLLGAGMRGTYAYASYALKHPDEIQFVAVAEPDKVKREYFCKTHSIPEDMCFERWEQLLEKPRLADALLICTQDKMHYEPAIKALEKGYHLLVEKPMSPDPLECIKMGELAKEKERVFLVCHVLRYTDFFSTIKNMLDEGRIGKLISIQHNENVAYWHQAHSFVRGNWRNSDETSPMILAKCCHDMDIMAWLAGGKCIKVSSFGSLTHFKKENAPKGAPERCLDGCPVSDECIYYAPRQYLTENTGWPTAAICTDMSIEGRTRALKEGPYGRCVYYCDNNVVDHQVVNLAFDNEVTAAFTMCAFTKDCTRTIKLMGTKGEIRGHMEKKEIEIIDFASGENEKIILQNAREGHGGGDIKIMKEFVRLVQSDGREKGLTSADLSVQSHIMAFAAEKSRLTGSVVEIDEYMNELTR
ncbi:MAG TPA: Gfo/Idh/MocA family oxidoreductase [Clostridiaceae bacterium]|nr:Gfo/Idh/MocA family oxidoreductase [Clostridiaceae bacterium]